jgi:exo-beta-1,3-glucanase (GH17 family)
MRIHLTVLVLLAAAACGGPTATLPDAGGAPFVRRHIPSAILARKAIAYSGYRTGQSPDIHVYPGEAEIEQDLELLVRGGWGFIRLFDTSTHAERVLHVIATKHLDLKVMLGVWISGGKSQHDAENQAEIARCVELVQEYADVIAAVSVGNEALDDWSNVKTAPAELAAYIAQVRAQVPQPVTTDDSYLPFLLGQDGATSYADVIQVARAADFLSVHVYAFADAFYDSWDWKQMQVPAEQRAMAMMGAAIAYTKSSVSDLRATMDAQGLDVPIVVGEWGWKSKTRFGASAEPEKAIERFFAHPYNQKVFYDAIMDWVYGAAKDASSPVAAFYFEAFDEPWKDEWGDDNWGLFDVGRTPKFVVQGLYPDLTPAGAPSYSEKDAVYYTP